jgi:hypothetical protein
MPNQGAAANRRPALRFTMMDNLNIFTASHAHGPAVAELGRYLLPAGRLWRT